LVGQANVARNLTQQRGRDVSARVERYCGAAAIWVPLLSMRAAASHLGKAEPLEDRHNLARLQDGLVAHSGDLNRRRADELRLEPGLAILQEQGDDFL
jgi:hypothetical protein